MTIRHSFRAETGCARPTAGFQLTQLKTILAICHRQGIGRLNNEFSSNSVLITPFRRIDNNSSIHFLKRRTNTLADQSDFFIHIFINQ